MGWGLRRRVGDAGGNERESKADAADQGRGNDWKARNNPVA